MLIKIAFCTEFREMVQMRHYVTEYWRDGRHFAEAWVQVNAFGRCFCLWKRRIALSDERPV